MKQYEDERLYARFNQLFVQLDSVDTAELIGVMTAMLRADKYNKALKVSHLTVLKG